MPRKPQFPPPIYPHRGVDRMRVYVDGKPVDYRLGPTGSEESRREYARLVREMAGGALPCPGGLVQTVGDLAARFLAHAKVKYRKADGTEKKELSSFRYALRALALVADTPVADFGPKTLKEVRAAMVAGDYL